MADKMEHPSSSSSSPCASCKLLRRRCTESCVLAPFFPPNEPQRYIEAHRVFGASNIIKMLEGIAMEMRADAVNSMVYEAKARHRDPVYGCAGIVWNLHQQLTKLQAEKAILQAQLDGALTCTSIANQQLLKLQAENAILQAQLNGATTAAFIANENNKAELLKPQSETRDPL
ncbi:hypothetical protein SUGI_0246610 [Cryptomeria japonica]|uniref:LOB domain-containing protein 11-like n=1 Tax=Cryptomeria japonica TaxID=3369 RepID=UPI002408985B|nr:LOB domain-containing protein 11-like [Cryptomeria japonica]GLJ15087.1 hypothetical protein SUGI_0246610 [Cryptomeria japonica]